LVVLRREEGAIRTRVNAVAIVEHLVGCAGRAVASAAGDAEVTACVAVDAVLIQRVLARTVARMLAGADVAIIDPFSESERGHARGAVVWSRPNTVAAKRVACHADVVVVVQIAASRTAFGNQTANAIRENRYSRRAHLARGGASTATLAAKIGAATAKDGICSGRAPCVEVLATDHRIAILALGVGGVTASGFNELVYRADVTHFASCVDCRGARGGRVLVREARGAGAALGELVRIRNRDFNDTKRRDLDAL
jgi:hypothetical protein